MFVTAFVRTYCTCILASLLLALVGCGGGSSGNEASNAEISGVVFDVDGGVVRDAVVNVNGQSQTRSNSSGAYTLREINGDSVIVRANVTQNGVDFYGENTVFLFTGERSKSVNIYMVPTSQRATLRGTVVNNQGLPIKGARVFAAATTMLTSTFATTDADGRFIIDTIAGGVPYDILASARGFNSDTDSVNIAAGDEDDILLTLGNETNTTLSPPNNFNAVVWTSPFEESSRMQHDPKLPGAIEAVKRLYDPGYASAKHLQSRAAVDGSPIETDLSWDFINNSALLGYGVYRRTGGSGTLNPIDFLDDPLAIFYADADDNLLEGQTYGYAVSALNTSYPDTSNSESDLTPVVDVVPLGGLTISPVTSPTTFHWSSGSGATSYVIYVFPDYPHVGIDSLWDNHLTPANGNSYVYDGPSLTSGNTYYYVVVGVANSNRSRTISDVGSFVAP